CAREGPGWYFDVW
nr:immunoglobulin heavy chain junction region [Mus musculus]